MGPIFSKSLYFYIKKFVNIINKIEKGPKIFVMHIVLSSSQNIQNTTD